MARMIDAGWWDHFEEGGGGQVDSRSWPTIAESDSWDEWMGGGTWVAREGEDFTTDAEEFMEEVRRRSWEANLSVDLHHYRKGSTGYEAVALRFRYFPPGFEKPLPVHLRYWILPDGREIELPANISLVEVGPA